MAFSSPVLRERERGGGDCLEECLILHISILEKKRLLA